MSEARTFVIVGAGLAGAKTAEALRTEGFSGRIVLLGAERHRPYERPPLSKGYLQRSVERESVFVHPPDWYDTHNIELHGGATVTAIDPSSHSITIGATDELGYDKLVLATGAAPRRLPVPGAELPGVHYLRSLDDADALRDSFGAGVHVVVIGAGWIGLETAAAARTSGAEVTVVESADLPLLRVLGPEMAAVFADLHRSKGVELRLGVGVASIRAARSGSSRAGAVVLTDGTEIDADVVVVGIGVTPEIGLATDAKLRTDNGVLVDEHLHTSDPDILAVGDIANAYHPLLHRHLRVEHWANALNQPAVAARTMLGEQASYDRLPYFYTDQFDLGMEYTGYVEPGGYDELVVRGDVAAREFVAFWLADGRVVAGMNVNVWDVTGTIGELIRSERKVARERLADSAVSWSDLLES